MFGNPSVATLSDVYSRLTGLRTDPIIFLGAGASVKSGIPASGDMVRLALRWLYAHQRGLQVDDPRIVASDVQHFLHEQPWYESGMEVSNLFTDVMESLDQPRELRRQFLLEMMSQATNPSGGYTCLAALMRRRWIHTILTTNFDDLLPIACGPGSVIKVAKPDEYPAISTAPSYPQIVYLHGQAEYYLDQNLHEEVQHLNAQLVERLLPLLRDHPLIILGYRGAEPSVMCDLFLNNAERADHFKLGVYWCVRTGADMPALEKQSPLVRELAHQIGRNFCLVPIQDFDAALVELRQSYDEHGLNGFETNLTSTTTNSYAPAISQAAHDSALPFDLRPVSSADLTSINWAISQDTMMTYARRLEQSIPSEPTEEWFVQQARSTGLATDCGGRNCLTNGGMLLLSGKGRQIAHGAWIEIRLPGRPPMAIDGSLWEQYEATLASLEDVNRPIRMKGARSETVRPYPESALKEVIANAIVHRDYETGHPIVVRASADAIRVESPGGLERGLLRRLLGGAFTGGNAADVPPDVLQRRLIHGERGNVLTAYRNCVLADQFYGAGIVDKVGSGLADTLDAMEAGGGHLLVEVAGDNTAFTVTLTRRAARVDANTQTAQPTRPMIRFDTNLLEVLALPSVIWTAPSDMRRVPDFREVPEARDWPRFVSYDGKLYTFADLSQLDNPLRGRVAVDAITAVLLSDFVIGPDGERRLTHLLHEVLFQHLSRQGLRTDWRGRRAYFICSRERGPDRYKQYRARVRQAQRRVAKWERSYCAHDAAVFRFERYGQVLALRITPTYVFTRDGVKEFIQNPEASSLATRHSTEDYNQKVLADMYFWRAMLGPREGAIRLDAGMGVEIILSDTPVSTVAAAPMSNGFENTEAGSRANSHSTR